MNDKIDVHGVEVKYRKAVGKFELDNSVSSENKKLIIDFLWDCKTGKTIKGKAKKKIGAHRTLKYLYALKKLAKWIGKPFHLVSQRDMEILVNDLEENVINNDGVPYGEETKLDYKKTLRKFYKWFGTPELVEFMDMSLKVKDVPTLSREEVENSMVNSTPDLRIKAAIMVLFDGGPRAEELLNIRIKDVEKRNYNRDSKCYFINIRHSKTIARTIPLPLCKQVLDNWLLYHPDSQNPEAQLIPISYPALGKNIRKLAQQVLKKRVSAHILRHSSATYWAPKMNRYQLCAKYGWSFSSDMPDRYIKRKGIIFDEIAEKGDTDQLIQLKRENNSLQDQIDDIQRQYRKVRYALEMIMPVVLEDTETFKQKILKRRIETLQNRTKQDGRYDLLTDNHAMKDASEKADSPKTMIHN